MKQGVLILMLIPFFPGCMIGPKLESTAEIDSPLSIGFTGDIMLGRSVNEKINEVRGYAYPWGNMLMYLHSTSLNIINLETTLTTSHEAVPKVFNFKADPDKVATLEQGSIDVVSLANNHSLDFGVEGLSETIAVLNNAGIKHVGAGTTIDEARKPVIITINNTRIAVLGYTDNEPGWLTGDNKPGTNYIEIRERNKERVKNDIQAVKQQADIVIATLHWGPNKRERPSSEFIDFAHHMIDVGADIIHGHSAHVFQAVEVYNNKLIMYDTGDFVDDYAVYPHLRNDRSFFYIVECKDHHLERLRLIPVLISNMQVNKATGRDFQETIQRFSMLCSEFGTHVEQTSEGAIIAITHQAKS